MAERVQISHYYTTGETSPSTSKIIPGELAMSIKSGNEALYLKNTDGKIAPFYSYNCFLNKENTFNNANSFNKPVSFTAVNFNEPINVLRNCSGITLLNYSNNFTLSGNDLIINNNANFENIANFNNKTNFNNLTQFAEEAVFGNGVIINDSDVIVNNGSVTSSGGFFDTSDERLKNFENEINVSLDDIKNIKKTYFYYKHDNNKEKHIGVSAQDIEKLYPEITNINSEGYLTVDYSKLSVIALKAIDILSEENKILKTKLTDLEKRLELLENK
jgi:hypothetical protein